ncbi:MAG TPA: hypothetical protein VFS83_02245 [Ktedonobacterales bacterium]|nr:hypothetical protein [Ktedonobacterales bacterium]
MQGEELPSNNGAGSGELTFSGELLTLFFIGMATVGMFVAATIYWPNQRHSVQWLLAFGISTYVLALSAIFVTIAMGRLRRRLLMLRLAVGCLLFTFGPFPPLLGSVAIAQAIVKLVGNRWENSDAMLGFILWGTSGFLLFLLLRRMIPTHR